MGDSAPSPRRGTAVVGLSHIEQTGLRISTAQVRKANADTIARTTCVQRAFPSQVNPLGYSSLNLLARIYNWSVPLEREALRRAVELADIQTGDRILDVATGTGALLQELGSRVHARQLIGIDRSRAMLSGARSLPAASRLVQADARLLPFSDASVDIVFVSYLLHLLRAEERAQVLETIARVLRPGGRLVTVTVDTPARVQRWLLGSLPAWTGLHPLDPRTELQRAGFHAEQAEYVATGWPSLMVLATAVTRPRA